MRKMMTLADKLFDAHIEYLRIEEDAMDEIIRTFGIDPLDADDWPFDGFTHDYYDYSFEFTQVDVGWEPTELQIETCWVLGFSRFWLNYTDGTEKYYYKKS